MPTPVPPIAGLLLRRIERRPDRTIGQMLVRYDGELVASPFGWVCEDTDRGLDSAMPLDELRRRKIKGKTAIPTGTYKLAWTLSPSRGVYTLRLLDVPGYQGILVHSGNRPEDTEGCICPGLTMDLLRGETRDSKKAVAWLDGQLSGPLLRGADVRIAVERTYAVP